VLSNRPEDDLGLATENAFEVQRRVGCSVVLASELDLANVMQLV